MAVRFMLRMRSATAFFALLAGVAAPSASAVAQDAAPAVASDPVPAYADLVELARASDIVARVVVADQAEVKPERAPGLKAGEARLYIEAETQALLAGRSGIGESLAFLADLPLTDRGKAPRIKQQVYLVFADLVPSRPGTIQLVGAGAMQLATPPAEAAVRRVLTQLAQATQPPVITGIREVMSVAGNLAGESETQIFLETDSGAPVSLSVIRRPSMAPQWGVSWSEIVDSSATAPAPETLAWYALACHLPPSLSGATFLSGDSPSRARAEADYRVILDSLGPCRGG